jgi:hypothetical protein
MGASGWSYFVPYDRDPNKALEALRWRVFRAGDYNKPAESTTVPPFEDFVPPDPTIWDDPDELAMWREMHRQACEQVEEPAPDSPDAALRQSGTEGTHSIIDITSVAETPDAASGPLAPERLEQLFGTQQPTRADVEAKTIEVQTARGRNRCTYVVVYDAELPSELFFAGYSGD